MGLEFSDLYEPKERIDLIGESQLKAYDVLVKQEPQIVFLTGPSGVGKSSVARLYASHLLNIPVEELNGHFYYNYIDGGGTKIDDWKDLTKMFMYRAIEPTVYMVDEADNLTDKSQVILNRYFEKGNLPENTYFILATLKPDNPTFRNDFKSRLTPHFHLTSPTEQEQKVRMLDIFKDENVLVEGQSLYELENPRKTITKEEANDVFNASEGSIRVLMNNIKAIIEGYFQTSEQVDNSDVYNLLISGNRDIKRLYNSTKKVTNFNSLADGICRNVVNGISYNKLKGNEIEQGKEILKVFGLGLPTTVDPRIAFHTLLLNFCD